MTVMDLLFYTSLALWFILPVIGLIITGNFIVALIAFGVAVLITLSIMLVEVELESKGGIEMPWP